MRLVRGLVVAVLVLAAVLGGLYYADGRLRERAEREVATALTTQLGTPGAPSVDIAGFPFLTQVIVGSIGSVHVVADDLGSTSDAPLPVEHADVVLTDVTSTDRFVTMTAGHAEGTAVLDYSALQAVAGVPLTPVGDGRVRATVSTTVFGQAVQAQITGVPSIDVGAQTLSLTDATIAVAGVTLPDFTSKALLNALIKPMLLTGIPLGLQVTAIHADDDAVRADISGDHLQLR